MMSINDDLLHVSRRKLLGALSVVAAALGLAACASSPSSSTATSSSTAAQASTSGAAAVSHSSTASSTAAKAAVKPAATATPKPEVTFTLWQIGNVTFPSVLPQGATVTDLMAAQQVGLDQGLLAGAAFHNIYPNIGIKPILKGYWSGKGKQELLTDLAGGTAPDIYPAIGDDPTPYVDQKLAADLTDYVKKWPLWKSIPPALQNVATVNGKIYALPTDKARGYGIVYRKDVFAEKGIATPGGNWTIDDFTTIAQKVADPAKKLWAISMLVTPWPNWYFDEWAQPMGVPVLTLFMVPSKDGTSFSMAPAEELAKPLKFYKDLVFTWKVALSGMSQSYGTMMSDIINGQAVMNLQQTVQMGGFFSHVGVKGFIQPDQIGLLPMPVGPDGLRNYDIGSNYWCINSSLSGRKLDLAWQTLTYFLAGPAEQLAVAVTGADGGIPPGPPIYPTVAETPDVTQRVPQQWSHSSKVAVGVPIAPDPGKFGIIMPGAMGSKLQDLINPFVQEVLLQANADPMDVATKMQNSINSQLYSQPVSGLTKAKWHSYYQALGAYFQKNYPKYYAGTYTQYYKKYESF